MSRTGLTGKVAVVVGGGGAIGAATAALLAEEGAHPIILGPEQEPPLHAVAERTGALAVVGDAADADVVRQAVALARERFGRLDILVTCPGGHGGGTALDTDDATWAWVLRVNLDTVFVSARECLPALIERRGAILVVSSLAGLRGAPRAVAYVTAKHALIGLVRSLACDYGPAGVRVNALCPGLVKTPMTDPLMDLLAAERGITRDDAYALLSSVTPLGRAAVPEEMAELIVFLVGDQSAIVTGEILTADAGACAVDVPTLALHRR